MVQIGKACAFFDCDASKEELERAMQDVRQKARTPNGLTTIFYERSSRPRFDEMLEEALALPSDYRVMSSDRMARGYEEERKPLGSLQYALVGEYNGVDNERVASELGDMLNVIRVDFNNDQGIFRGAVAYENEAGEYVLHE